MVMIPIVCIGFVDVIGGLVCVGMFPGGPAGVRWGLSLGLGYRLRMGALFDPGGCVVHMIQLDLGKILPLELGTSSLMYVALSRTKRASSLQNGKT